MVSSGMARTTSIPLFDTGSAVAALRGEIDARIAEILDRGTYILGPELKGFEAEFGDYLGAKHVIGVGNGTDAITLALRAMGVGEGDEVIVPSFTFSASAEAIAPTGAVPVFCDIDLDTYNITAETVKPALTPRTKAVIAVDLFGNPAPIPEIEALGVPVLEDAAQAAGASLDGTKAGALGHAATFSFYPSKNLGAFGDAGAIATSDDGLAEAARMLRSHGSRDKVGFERLGFNTRMDELQAGILRVLLPHLDEWCDGRRQAARNYSEAGMGEIAVEPQATPGSTPAWHLYVARHPRPDDLSAALTEAGIGNRIYYRTPTHRQPPMLQFAGDDLDLPATDEASRTTIALPMSSTLSAEDAAEIVSVLRRVHEPVAG